MAATTVISNFKLKLDVLGCPFVENSTEEVVKELLFSPGEHRLRLLQWLFGKVNTNIYNHIDKQPKYIGSDDWRWTNLLSASCALGLTNRSDLDVIAGTASEEKQLCFYDKLLNLAIVMDRVESADRVSGHSILKEQYTRDVAFLTSAVEHSAKTNAFPNSISLLPMDLTRLVQENWKEKAWRPGEKPPVPDRKHLAKQVSDLVERLRKERQALSDVRKNCASFTPDSLDETARACVRSRYSLVLNGLSQILTDFSYCFANDMEVWCSGGGHRTGEENALANDCDDDAEELGPLVKQASRLVKSLHLLVEDFRSLARLPCDLRNCSELDAIAKKTSELDETIRRNFAYFKTITLERNLSDK